MIISEDKNEKNDYISSVSVSKQNVNMHHVLIITMGTLW